MQKFSVKLCILFALASFTLISNQASSQELDAIVDVDLSAINIDVRDRLSTFKTEVQNYLNRTRFTDENIANDVRGKPYKIKVNFSFYFKNATGIDSYEAQLVVSVQRNIYKTQNFTTVFRVKDESWGFNYVKGQNFYHDDLKYNNLTSFLDYYAYMIIGYDDDSWEPALGTKRFQSAQNIVNLAIANSDGRGWIDNSSLKQSRSVYPSELLNSKYDKFRRAVWMYHFAGIDSLQYDKKEALEKIAEALDIIGKFKKTEIRSFTIKQFFDAKYMEIASALVDYYDKSIYRRLMDYDPDHTSTYDEYAKK
ncbi:MAG: DUF4835 family protein [Ignavibacteria bacterium]|nr:DUF4835 family protein [Ignavibacteria bacterium]